MSLFGALNDDIFQVFSRGNRRLYAEVILAIFRSFFSSLGFPRRNDVVSEIYKLLTQKPGLWSSEDGAELFTFDEIETRRSRLRRKRHKKHSSEATSDAIKKANHIYVRLVKCGWLEEVQYGIRETVSMPYASMLLAGHLDTISQGFSPRLAGIMVEVNNALDSAYKAPAENGAGLNQAAGNLARFVRDMLAVRSSLNDFEKEVIKADKTADRLKLFFNTFVEKILLRDFKAIIETSHPYRFRGRILKLLREVIEDENTLESLSRTYEELGVAQESKTPREQVYQDLETVRMGMETITLIYKNIQEFRGKLESRLHFLVKYSDQANDDLQQRLQPVIRSLNNISIKEQGEIYIESPVWQFVQSWSPGHLAEPRAPRRTVEPKAIVLKSVDPFYDFLEEKNEEFENVVMMSGEQVSRFLERTVPPGGSEQLKDMDVNSLEDAMAVEAIRLVMLGVAPDRMRAVFDGHFEFEESPEKRIDNGWFECDNITIYRKTNNITELD